MSEETITGIFVIAAALGFFCTFLAGAIAIENLWHHLRTRTVGRHDKHYRYPDWLRGNDDE